jgi:hypothetical protein
VAAGSQPKVPFTEGAFYCAASLRGATDARHLGSETRQQHEFPAMLHWIYSIACQHPVAIDITQPATRWKKASR